MKKCFTATIFAIFGQGAFAFAVGNETSGAGSGPLQDARNTFQVAVQGQVRPFAPDSSSSDHARCTELLTSKKKIDSINLSNAQKQQLNDAVRKAGFSSFPRLLVRENPHLRIYVVAFDGTMNDREAVQEYEQPTLVANFERDLKKSPILKSEYLEGVGTRTNFLNAKWQGATGIGSLERAKRAYTLFRKQVDDWRKADQAIQVHVHTMSFSRGGGSAIHFLNMVDQQGAQPAAGGPFAGKKVPDALQPGKITSSATLLETVVTGQRQTLTLGLPKSTLAVLQITADLERRRAFSYTDTLDPARGMEISQIVASDMKREARWALLTAEDDAIVVYSMDSLREQSKPSTEPPTAIYQRVQSVHLPGVHSDIGGTYCDGGIRDVSKYIVDSFHQNLGFGVAYSRPDAAQISAAFAHESRWDIDKLVDMILGDNIRGHFPGAVTGWDGTPKYEVVRGASRGNGDSTMKETSTHLGKPAEGLALPASGFVKHDTLLSMDQAGYPVFSKVGSTAYGYNAQVDRVTLYGQPLDFLGGKAEIGARIATEGGSLLLSVTPQKYLPLYTIASPVSDGANNPGSATPSPIHAVIEAHATLTPSTPEEALQDVFTSGLRSMNQEPQNLSIAELAQVVKVLSQAKPRDRLVIGKSHIELGTNLHIAPGFAVFDANRLRDAVGVARQFESIQMTEGEVSEAPHP